MRHLFKDSERDESSVESYFIEVGCVGIRRSSRIQRQKEGSSSASKGALFRDTRAIILVAMHELSMSTVGENAVYHCCSSQISSCNYFLHQSFDRGYNVINLVACSASIVDNDVHTLGEMKRQPYQTMFEKSIVKEMKTLMDK